ncbi:YdeI/OmpD-associated family protein [Candidatus Woesearchaeota archaeon]|nr:YdeI/OmpD-associated family protein [Candidatus Woesearchaeota archaeon]
MTKKRIQNGVVHKVPMDLRNALTSHSDVLAEWNNLTPLARNEWICWTT